MENYKIYIDTEKKNVKIKFSISYTKEQNNWATNETIVPGYRVHARPVEIEDKGDYTIESFGAFTGFGDTLLPCGRRSQKRYDEAKRILDERMLKYLAWFEDKGYHICRDAKNELIEQQEKRLAV